MIKAHELGLSDWCDTTKYDVELPNGTIESFFEKVSDAGLLCPCWNGTVCVADCVLAVEGLWGRGSRDHPGPLAL